MNKTAWNAIAGNLALWTLALTVSCGCLCGEKPTAGSIGSAPSRAIGQAPTGRSGEAWRFVVSGDSRNCGDVVMPAIAAGAKIDGAKFYWHLGDLRAIYDFDQDMVQEAKVAGKPSLTISEYEKTAWDDFDKNQVAPFANIPVPFYLGIGNHETVKNLKTRCEFARHFEVLLNRPEFNRPELQGGKRSPTKGTNSSAKEEAPNSLEACANNCKDCEQRRSETYYQWVREGVAFIYLDNATDDQFDNDQAKWFEDITGKDAADKGIVTVVVGMHKALPWSVSCDHSMNESPRGIESGMKVYQRLLELQNKYNKRVYVLASHSHFFMQDVFNTKHWRDNGGILPGWIVGTAGARRYPLPPAADLTKSKTYVYGYLLGRVFPDGSIDFDFTELKRNDIPSDVKARYTERFISETCFAGNRQTEPSPEREYCKENPAKTQ